MRKDRNMASIINETSVMSVQIILEFFSNIFGPTS